MLAAIVVFVYLAIVLYVGIFAFRKGTSKAEDFFVANRSLGTFVFLLSLFGSNMTSFAILGSSGLSFRQGIGVYGLMASISGIVIPLSIFFIGTRIWALGKKFGHMTQVQIFRDRWEMGHIGTLIFALQAVMLVPYIIIGVMGGGETLEGVSNGFVPYWFGGLIVAVVVMLYVFFGGMRGTAWVNTMQTLMFLVFGTVAFIIIARGFGGFTATVERMEKTLAVVDGPRQSPAGAATVARATEQSVGAAIRSQSDGASKSAPATRPATPPATPSPRPDGELLTRARIPFGYYFSYMFIPLSSIMFPHIAIFCLTAKRMSSFRKTVILYPLCIMAIWLPAVFLGAMASSRPEIIADTAVKSTALSRWIESGGKTDLLNAGADKEAFALARALEANRGSDPEIAQLLAGISTGNLTVDAVGDRLGELTPTRPWLRGLVRQVANTNSDGIMLALLTHFAPGILAGVLGAAIMACVMASDSQILALSTMWAEDVYRHYGGTSEARQVWSARVFVIVLTVVAYVIAIAVHQYANIFELAIQYAFSGYASMAPIMLACLFWKRSTKWGALAATVWVAACLIASTILQASTSYAGPPGGSQVIWRIGDFVLLNREAVRLSFTEHRFLLVLPMFLGSALLMWLFSVITPAPSASTIDKYFPPKTA